MATCIAICMTMQAHVLADDPTRPPSWAGAAVAESAQVRQAPLVLNQILVSHRRDVPSRVVISGELLQQGDRIRGYRLSAINPDNVLLENGQKQLRLSLLNKGVRRNPSASESSQPQVSQVLQVLKESE